MESKHLNKVLKQATGNRLRNGSKHPYQVIKEDIYEMTRRRKLKLDEFALAVYLRGKAKRYGNPFKLSNSTIYYELHTTRRVVNKVKAKLQLKGIIKYNKGTGKTWTEYTMLDSVMLPQVKGLQGYPQGYAQGVPKRTP